MRVWGGRGVRYREGELGINPLTGWGEGDRYRKGN